MKVITNLHTISVLLSYWEFTCCFFVDACSNIDWRTSSRFSLTVIFLRYELEKRLRSVYVHLDSFQYHIQLIPFRWDFCELIEYLSTAGLAWVYTISLQMHPIYDKENKTWKQYLIWRWPLLFAVTVTVTIEVTNEKWGGPNEVDFWLPGTFFRTKFCQVAIKVNSEDPWLICFS